MKSTILRYIGAMAGLLCVALALQILTAPVVHADGVADAVGSVLGGGLDVLSGGILGAVSRLAPEVLRVFTNKSDHDHEYRMAQLSLETAKLNAAATEETAKISGNLDYAKSGLDTLKSAIEGQAQKTGFSFIDAINAAVRPLITYWWLSLYTLVKIGIYGGLVAKGSTASQAAIAIWTPFDIATFGAIINFWFLDRVLKHRPL